LAPEVDQPADGAGHGPGGGGHSPDQLGPHLEHRRLVIARRGLGLGRGGRLGLGVIGRRLPADADGGEQGGQQGHHRVFGHRPGQPPRAAAAVDGQQGHHRGGQGDGE
jgi:hypothetical protein